MKLRLVLHKALPISSAIFIVLLLIVGYTAKRTLPVARAATPIQHIVFLYRENRAFDSMFGTFPGANGATTYKDKSGVLHPLGHETLTLPGDICHSYACAKAAEDGGKMDGFASAGLVQFYQGDIPNYWQYAQNFGLADANFSQIDGPTFGNHLYAIAGTDDNVDSYPKTASGGSTTLWGCDAPSGAFVEERSPTNVIKDVYPCFGMTSLADQLNSAGISWHYYAQTTKGGSGYQFSTYDAIKQIRNGTQWKTNVVPYSSFASDAASGKLPAVSWVTATTALSDHPPSSICTSENWAVQQINAVMSGPDWASTAIVLSWDDWGGFYDHVPPVHVGQANNLIETGMRTPLVMISPFSKGGVDHTQFVTVSMVRFAEDTFGLTPLGEAGSATGLGEMLNFLQPPLPPLILAQRTCPAAATPYGPASITPGD